MTNFLSIIVNRSWSWREMYITHKYDDYVEINNDKELTFFFNKGEAKKRNLLLHFTMTFASFISTFDSNPIYDIVIQLM